MITFRGAVLVVAAIFTFLLARLTQVGWLYLLDALLWGTIFLSLAMPWLAVMSLSVRRRVVRIEGRPGSLGPSEGDLVRVETGVQNTRVWPRYLLTVSWQCPLVQPEDSHLRYFLPHLGAADSMVLDSTLRCYRRGLYQFDPAHVESKGPFGLFRRRRSLPAALSVLVYPRIYPMQSLPLLDGTQGTGSRPRKVREGQEMASTRHYFPGDPLRSIHWRNTARTGKLMVKEYEDTQDNTLVITFSSSQDTGLGPDTTLEYSIKLAASVASYVQGRGAHVRVVTGDLSGQEMPWVSLLKELAMLKAGQGSGLPRLLDSLPPGARVLAIVSDQDLPGAGTLIQRAGRMSALAVVVLEGFGEPALETAGSTSEKLAAAGVAVTSCRPGSIEDALRALEQLDLFPATRVTGARAVSGRAG